MNDNGIAARNRQLVESHFPAFAAGDIEALRDLFHEDFVEHSPGNPSGRDAFLAFMAASPVTKAKMDLKRVIADDEYVVLHYHLLPPGDERGVAIVDILRLADGKIVEHWDVKQPVPGPEEVPHGMF
ncbi:nuclear transport factor 2 family protein [Nonomuraea sp. NPDC050783]|uniref:nuclear transport factor 2 family protein n=1 Tax=Nonomuraea sp. NPDC050783 TaxID=3154634 RepID=UPI00346790A3